MYLVATLSERGYVKLSFRLSQNRWNTRYSLIINLNSRRTQKTKRVASLSDNWNNEPHAIDVQSRWIIQQKEVNQVSVPWWSLQPLCDKDN